MKKTALILCILISNIILSQTVNWETKVGNDITNFVQLPKSVVVVYGDNTYIPNVTYKPDVVVLDKFTGEKLWSLKNPIDLMPGAEYVSIEYIEEHNLIRFGHLLLVDADTGVIKFNPVKEGIAGVLHSTIFPEGILATVGKNRNRYEILIPFETCSIAWTHDEDQQMDSFTNKKDKMMYNMMKDDPNMSQSLPQISYTSSPHKGYYYKGHYIVQFFKEIICYDLKTGLEKWKYRSKKFFNGYVVSENTDTGQAVIFASTQKGFSAGKNILYALDINTGEVLWEKPVNHSIARLIPINDINGVLIEPKKSIGKRYLQVYDKQGTALLEEKSVKSFGHGIIGVLKTKNNLVIIADSGEISTPAEIHFGLIKVGISQRGRYTKFKALVNIINLDTKQYIFEKRFKTGDTVQYLELLEDGVLILENNQAYVVDYNTGEKKESAIKSNYNLLFRDYGDKDFYVFPEILSKVYKIDRNSGQIHTITDLSLTDIPIKYISDLTFGPKGYTILGYSHDNEFAFIELDQAGQIVRASTTLSEEEKISSQIGHFIVIDNRVRRNIGRYIMDYDNNLIIHVPVANVVTPLDKKAINYNSQGVISAKTYK